MSDIREKLAELICTSTCNPTQFQCSSRGAADAILAKFDVTEKRPRFWAEPYCGEWKARVVVLGTTRILADFDGGFGGQSALERAREYGDFLNSKEPK